MASSGDDLLPPASSGDTRALRKLLEEHAPAVRKWLAGKIPHRWQSVLSVDDVMQQTYTDAFLDIKGFVLVGGDSFGAWLMKLAQCNLVDALRMLEAEKRGEGRRPITPPNSDDSCMSLYESLMATSSTPSRQAARDEALAALNAALEQLPDDYRHVVQMYDLEGRPVEEVARVLQRSPGAVFMIRKRAHCRLRRIIGGNGSQYFSAT
jgi:RNA polymerase sigma-70 factor, ECF subfamily